MKKVLAVILFASLLAFGLSSGMVFAAHGGGGGGGHGGGYSGGGYTVDVTAAAPADGMVVVIPEADGTVEVTAGITVTVVATTADIAVTVEATMADIADITVTADIMDIIGPGAGAGVGAGTDGAHGGAILTILTTIPATVPHTLMPTVLLIPHTLTARSQHRVNRSNTTGITAVIRKVITLT